MYQEYQELQYLREELNQRVCLLLEHGTKTINIILIIWGGIIAFLGTRVIDSINKYPENVILCFIGATIFFISNMILRSLARKYHDDTDAIFGLSTYILVFYEKCPSNTVKVGKNFSWEMMNFDIMVRDKRRNSFYIRRDEYNILSLISLVFILVLSVVLFFVGGKIGIVLSLICVFYTIYSIHLVYDISKNTSTKNDYGMRIKHLNNYLQYSIVTEHYTEQEIEDRFGDIYEICKQYMQKQKSSKRKRTII